jgi:peptide-methionine (R)-S-oxide reductase
MSHSIARRQFLAGTALAAATIPLAKTATAKIEMGGNGDEEFQYEVVRTKAEWLERLTEAEYRVLREAKTEEPKSTPLWQETRNGTYTCRGCDLPVYKSSWNVQLEKGWVFFNHGVPNSLLMDVDWPKTGFMNQAYGILATIETHCRRCGSHMGHIFIVEGTQLHCINGTSLVFTEESV